MCLPSPLSFSLTPQWLWVHSFLWTSFFIVLAFLNKSSDTPHPFPHPCHPSYSLLLRIPFPWLDFHSVNPTLVPVLTHCNSLLKPRRLPSVLLLLSAGSRFFTLLPTHMRGTQWDDSALPNSTNNTVSHLECFKHTFPILQHLISGVKPVYVVGCFVFCFVFFRVKSLTFRIKMEKSISYWKCEKKCVYNEISPLEQCAPYRFRFQHMALLFTTLKVIWFSDVKIIEFL